MCEYLTEERNKTLKIMRNIKHSDKEIKFKNFNCLIITVVVAVVIVVICHVMFQGVYLHHYMHHIYWHFSLNFPNASLPHVEMHPKNQYACQNHTECLHSSLQVISVHDEVHYHGHEHSIRADSHCTIIQEIAF
jgi:hypothetical protein